MKFILIFGHGHLGAIPKTVQCVQQAVPTLKVLIILNKEGNEYTDLLPSNHVLRSDQVNLDHKKLADEIISRIKELGGKGIDSVVALMNYQDFMWPCFIDMCDFFTEAKQYPPKEVVLKTAVKPSLRYMTNNKNYSALGVEYAVVPMKDALTDNPFDSNLALGTLAKKYQFLIVKPLMGGAGAGVTKIDSMDANQLKSASLQAVRFCESVYGSNNQCYLYESESKIQLTQAVLVEEYVEGQEYSIEGLADENGLPKYIVQQLKGTVVEMPCFRDLEYVVTRPREANPEIKDAVKNLLALINYRNRAFHIEIKVSAEGRIRPIEFNPRPGGGSIMKLVSSVHGVDMLTLPLCAFLNTLEIDPFYIVTRVVQPDNTGIIDSYEGDEYVASQPDCCAFEKLVPIGSKIEELSSEVYLIEFCVFGSNLEQTRKRGRELSAAIQPKIIRLPD